MRFRWMRLFVPRYRVASIAQIPRAWIEGYRCIVVDVDNTLAVPETTAIPEEVRAWIHAVQQTHRVVCVSNSMSMQKRQQALERMLGCSVLVGAGRKPFRRIWGVLENTYGVTPATTVVIGDRIFPDVLFGNRVGALTVLVEPFSTHESLWIQLLRRGERWFLKKVSPADRAAGHGSSAVDTPFRSAREKNTG
ncbi:MAG: HAD-superfamily hydrolase [Parcubacteria group bacterium Gr01-1014_106]|nr:MAG: HAD-superfamily hydrolase [Parcubacteria group bacterium Gr01-1014_106]